MSAISCVLNADNGYYADALIIYAGSGRVKAWTSGGFRAAPRLWATDRRRHGSLLLTSDNGSDNGTVP